jgi:7-cyano-7-deazaguanine reductase
MGHSERPGDNPLGQTLASPTSYAPEILFPIARGPARKAIGLSDELTMHGFDHWQAFEISWLDMHGKPHVAIADLYFDCNSPSIVESKSLKLYLNSFNHERIHSTELLCSTVKSDLEIASGSAVEVVFHSLHDYRLLMTENFARDLDCRSLKVDLDQFPLIDEIAPLDASMLKVTRLEEKLRHDNAAAEKRYVSDLFRSNCPVTNQPDWASIEINVSGIEIEESSLLSYLCSFRNHQGYHEECAERIFVALSHQCKPESLQVSMNYLRRGGLDINVYRSSSPVAYTEKRGRDVRQ